MSNSQVSTIGFSVLSTDTIAEMVEDGLDKNSILHGSAQYSDDEDLCFIVGEYETYDQYFETGRELFDWIYENGWTEIKPE